MSLFRFLYSSIALSGCLTFGELFAQNLPVSIIEVLRQFDQQKSEVQFQKSHVMALKESSSMPIWENPSLSTITGYKSGFAESGLYYGANLSQPLPLNGVRSAQKDVSLANLQSAQDALRQKKILSHAELIKLTFQLDSARAIESHAADRFRRFQLIERHIFSRPNLSPALKAQRGIIEARLSILRSDNARATGERRKVEELLKSYLNLTQVPEISLPELPAIASLNAERDTAFAQNYSLYLQSLKAEIQKSDAELAYQEALKYPPVSLQAVFNEEPGPVTPLRFFGAGVSVGLPLWNRNSNNRAAAEINSRVSRERYEYSLQRLALEGNSLRSMLSAESDALDDLKQMKSNEQERRLNVAESDFLRGRLDAFSFLELEASLHEALHQWYAARMRYITLWCEYEIWLGHSFSESEGFYASANN